jgi:hypothetical protein
MIIRPEDLYKVNELIKKTGILIQESSSVQLLSHLPTNENDINVVLIPSRNFRTVRLKETIESGLIATGCFTSEHWWAADMDEHVETTPHHIEDIYFDVKDEYL